MKPFFRSLASALVVCLASIAFIATPAPPVYTITKQEQTNTITLSPQNPSVTKKIKVTIDPKMIVRRVEKQLREDASMIAISPDLGAWPSGLPQDLLVEIKYPDDVPVKAGPFPGRWIEQPSKDILASAAVFEYCDWEAPCQVEVIAVFTMNNLTEEVTIPWILRVYLNGMNPTKNERQQGKADKAVQVSISD
jgi:hypothetical protein